MLGTVNVLNLALELGDASIDTKMAQRILEFHHSTAVRLSNQCVVAAECNAAPYHNATASKLIHLKYTSDGVSLLTVNSSPAICMA